MSQTAYFFTDYLFPGLLVGCGCLGLVVVNLTAHQPSGSRRKGHQVAQPQPAVPMAPAHVRPATPASSVMSARVVGPQPRTAPLRRLSRPTVHNLDFAKRRTRVTDAERERLRIFLAGAKPGSGSRVTVVGHGAGRRGRRRARKRARRVVALLQQLGVDAASIAEPKVAPNDGGAGGSAVTIVIRKR